VGRGRIEAFSDGVTQHITIMVLERRCCTVTMPLHPARWRRCF
jgi:uncharacterized membrane protein